jgi:hypothetical protein
MNHHIFSWLIMIVHTIYIDLSRDLLPCIPHPIHPIPQATAQRLPEVMSDCGPITIAKVWHAFEAPWDTAGSWVTHQLGHF